MRCPGIGHVQPEQEAHARHPIRVGPSIGVELPGQISVRIDMDARRNDIGGNLLQVGGAQIHAPRQDQRRAVGIIAARELGVVDDPGL